MMDEGLRSELSKPWRHGEHYDGRGMNIDAPVDLAGCALRGFDLSGATFSKVVDASSAEFLGLAWFRGARFRGPVCMAGAACRFDLHLEDIDCPVLDLTGLRMEGVLRLDRARVGRLILSNAVLLANLSLAEADVGDIVADDLEIMGGLWTRGSKLELKAFRPAHIEGRT